MAEPQSHEETQLQLQAIGIQGLDPAKLYSIQEANQIRNMVVQAIVDHAAAKSNWMCLLNVQKKDWCSKDMSAFTVEALKEN